MGLRAYLQFLNIRDTDDSLKELTIGQVADGQALVRSGDTVIGGASAMNCAINFAEIR